MIGHIIYNIDLTKLSLHHVVMVNNLYSCVQLFQLPLSWLCVLIQDGIVSDAWTNLEKDGILEDRLIQHMWEGFLEKKEALVELMAKFDLICEVPVERLQQDQQDAVDTEVKYPAKWCSDPFYPGNAQYLFYHKYMIRFIIVFGFLSLGLRLGYICGSIADIIHLVRMGH